MHRNDDDDDDDDDDGRNNYLGLVMYCMIGVKFVSAFLKYLQHDCGQNVVYIMRYMETKSRTVVRRHSWNLVHSISCHFIPHQKKGMVGFPATKALQSVFPTVFRSLMLL